MEYPDSFVWRGLTFPRVEREDPQLAHYRCGNWIVWSEIPLGRRTEIWWRASWQATRFKPSLAPTGDADSYELALERCLGRLEAHARKHAIKVQDLQRDLGLMLEERDALVKDLLALILVDGR